jgi:hypothetical protein
MNSAEIKRLTHLSVNGNANAKRQLSNAFKQAIKNLAEYRKKEAAARARAEANEASIVAILSAGLPTPRPLSRAQKAEVNKTARAVFSIKNVGKK